MPADQHARATAFRVLHEGPGAFVMPNPWDAGTARLLAGLGFPALGTTSAGFAFSLGRRDTEGALSRQDVLENAGAIVAATDLPVSADLESGYGATPEDVAETIRQAAAIGLVGGSVEDATGTRSAPIRDVHAAAERVAAAVEAARSLPFPFTITARAENFLYGRPDLDDTIRRLLAYEAVGADVLYAPGLPSLEAIRTVCSALSRPVNVVMGLKGAAFSIGQLAEAGVKRISLGSSLSRAALGAVLRAGREILEEGTFTFAETAMPFAEANDRTARGR